MAGQSKLADQLQSGAVGMWKVPVVRRCVGFQGREAPPLVSESTPAGPSPRCPTTISRPDGLPLCPRSAHHLRKHDLWPGRQAGSGRVGFRGSGCGAAKTPTDRGRALLPVGGFMTAPQAKASKLLRECLGMEGAVADRVAIALPDLDRFRLDAALRFLRRATLPTEVFFFVESLVAAKQWGKCNLVKKLFRDHATREDKIELAAGWAFTEPYKFGSAVPLPVRHVMYADCRADMDWIRENWGDDDSFGCSTGVKGLASPCPCERWLREKEVPEVDRALDAVVGHLCDMRHSLVHESWPVFMITEPAPPDSLGSSMLDCYPCEGDLASFRTYESGITLGRFRAIAVATARSYLSARYP